MNRRAFLKRLAVIVPGSVAVASLPKPPAVSSSNPEETRRIIDNQYWCVGPITKIEAPDPDNYGKFITVATIKED